MIDAAQNAGAVFDPITNEYSELLVPTALVPLSEKAIASATAIRSGIAANPYTPAEIDIVAQDYIHCSANWNTIVLDRKGKVYGGTYVSETIGFVNRPDEDWHRTTYNLDGVKK